MFKKKQPPIRTLIGEGTRIEGRIAFSDALRIDGEIVGDVIAADDSPTLLVISEKARVTGKVKARHVIINGTVEGPVESDELLELQPKARIFGDVSYQALEMHQGAAIEGVVHALKAVELPAPNALKLASNNG